MIRLLAIQIGLFLLPFALWGLFRALRRDLAAEGAGRIETPYGRLALAGLVLVIGAFLVEAWERLGRPAPFNLVEFGPGRGTLMADLLRVARRVPAFVAAARLGLVETSPRLRARQAATLAGGPLHPTWYGSVEEIPEGPLVAVANEFFDALPIRQFQRDRGVWRERMVGLDDEGRLRFGLGATALTAFATASSVAAMQLVASSYLVLILVELGLVLALSFLARKLSPAVAGLMFLAYSVVNGLTLSAVFLVYGLGTVGNAFAVTAGVFGAMTLYATVTRKDLSGWGSFLFIGLIGVLVAGVVNIFLMNDMLGFVVSCACVVVFAGLTAYDTQKLRTYFSAAYAGGGSGTGSLAIVGALMLYLDFVNLFLAILRLFGRRD